MRRAVPIALMLLAASPLPGYAQRTPAEATAHALEEQANACAQRKPECPTPTPRPTSAPILPTLTPTPAPAATATPTPEPEPAPTAPPCWATAVTTDEAGDEVVDVVYYLDGTPMTCAAYDEWLAWLAAQPATDSDEPPPQPAPIATSVPTAPVQAPQPPPAPQVIYVTVPQPAPPAAPVAAPFTPTPIRTSIPVSTATMVPSHTPYPTLTPTPTRTPTTVPTPRPPAASPTPYVSPPATWRGLKSPWAGFAFPTFHVKLPGWPPPPPSAESYWVAVLPTVTRIPEPQVMYLLPPPE